MSVLTAGDRVPHMDTRMQKEKCAAGKNSRPCSLGSRGKPEERKSRYKIGTPNVTDKMDVGWSGLGDARNMRVPM